MSSFNFSLFPHLCRGLETNEHMQIQAPKSPNPISGDIDNLQAVTEISSVNEISEHQRHRHQHISNPLVNRRP